MEKLSYDDAQKLHFAIEDKFGCGQSLAAVDNAKVPKVFCSPRFYNTTIICKAKISNGLGENAQYCSAIDSSPCPMGFSPEELIKLKT